MGLQQQLACVAAVIVLIAAFAVPSLAIAHEGHAHHRSQVAPTSSESTSEDVRAPDVHAHEQSTRAALLSATLDSPTAAGGATRCSGGCCSGGAGMACCGAALAPDLFWIPFPQASAQLGIPRAPPLPGLPPEALPKPPKSIA